MVNKWGVFFLLLMTLPIMGHVVILPIMLDVAGRDGWISIFLAVPFGILFIFAIYKLRQKYMGPDFMAALRAQTGKWITIPLGFLLAVYLLFLSVYSLASLVDMVHIGFLPDTPIWVLTVWFMIFCFYAILKGVRAIALTSIILGISGMFTGHTVTAMATPEKELANLLPIMEFGVAPLLWGTLILSSIWIESLFLLLLPIENIKEKRFFLLLVVGVLLNGLTMFSTLTGAVMIFGMGLADQFTFPALETVRIISLGFIDRFDIYGMMLMSYGCYIRTSLYLRLAYQLIIPPNKEKAKSGKILLWILALGITYAAIYMAENHLRMVQTGIFYAWLVVLYPLPFILLLFSKRDQKEGQMA